MTPLKDYPKKLPKTNLRLAGVLTIQIVVRQPGISPATVAHKFKKLSLPDPVIVKKWFDQLNDSDLPSQISFALLDGDFYRSIKTSFEKVAPRMASGGVIIVHDYRNAELPGVTKAVGEFLDNHLEEYDFSLRASLAILRRK